MCSDLAELPHNHASVIQLFLGLVTSGSSHRARSACHRRTEVPRCFGAFTKELGSAKLML